MSEEDRQYWWWWVNHWKLPGSISGVFVKELGVALDAKAREKRDRFKLEAEKIHELAHELVRLYRENYRAGVPADDFESEVKMKIGHHWTR